MPSEERLGAMLSNPVEGLNREVKAWIDPSSPEGRAKIVTALLALRNRDGGELVIGFDDSTLKPVPYSLGRPVAEAFAVDTVQTALFKHASAPFEVSIDLIVHEDQEHPVLSVPSGVEVPVACKSELVHEGKRLLRKGKVYFRTLNESGVPSSAPINARDWPAFMQILHDNRDANIGRFLRRHLGGGQIERLRDAAAELATGPALPARAREALVRGDAAYDEAIARRRLSPEHTEAISGLQMTVAAAFDPPRDRQVTTRSWLNSVLSANPQYTGWPIWLDTSSFDELEDRPAPRGGAWEASIVSIDRAFSAHADFWRLAPGSSFYLRRAMQDDMTDKVPRGAALDVVLMLYRVAETIIVAKRMARAAGWGDDDRAGIAFRWTALRGRQLRPWANARTALIGSMAPANDDEASSFIELPLDRPDAAFAPQVAGAVAPLFATFGGYEVRMEVVEEAVRKLLERSL